MRWRSWALSVLAMSCLAGRVIAQEPTTTAMFQTWVVGRSHFAFVGGRISSTSNAWMFGVTEQTAISDQVREQVHLNGAGNLGSLTYSFQRGGSKGEHPVDPNLEFVVEINSEGRFVMRYMDKDHPSRFFNLTQVPGQPISLSLPPSDKPRVLHAPSIWHLVIIHGDECKQVVPMLESLRSGWHINLTAQTIEDELVKMAAVSRKSDRKQWETWVRQLGDPRYTARERADKHLRDVGPAILGFMTRLHMSELDPEQQSRVHAIIRILSTQTTEDTPERVAATMIEDPLIWLALLSRREASTRQAAAQQLAVILNRPIGVDPTAEPDTQAKARDALRAQIEKVVGAESKPEDGPNPAGRIGRK
jgi:hypothetical protein